MGEVDIVRQVGTLAQAMVGELRLPERSARRKGPTSVLADHEAVASLR